MQTKACEWSTAFSGRTITDLSEPARPSTLHSNPPFAVSPQLQKLGPGTKFHARVTELRNGECVGGAETPIDHADSSLALNSPVSVAPANEERVCVYIPESRLTGTS
ncbi:hypothetical protein PM082_005876 [Marasmius tenuissimus]|nr:hypothetical protein PM082_005876 [Marasmius tenuissimus]